MADPLLPVDHGNDGVWGPIINNAILDTSRRADGRLPAFVRTATAYTAVLADIGTTIYRNLTVANTVTIPTGIGQPEDRLLIRQKGTGPTTVAAGSGMTAVSVGKTAPFVMAGAGAMVEVVWETATLFYIDGALA